MTGAPLATAPLGGWTVVAEAAAKHADRVFLSAKVTSIKRGDRPRVAWVQGGKGEQAEEFDKVIFTGAPRHILAAVDLDKDEHRLLQDQAGEHQYFETHLVAHTDEGVVPELRPEWKGAVPFYVFTDFGLHTFSNGAKPPYLSYFRSKAQFEMIQKFRGIPAPDTVTNAWTATSWLQTKHRRSIGQFLREVNGR